MLKISSIYLYVAVTFIANEKDEQMVVVFMASPKLSWYQIFEDGGLWQWFYHFLCKLLPNLA